MGNSNGYSGAAIRAERAAAIEAKPTDPQHRGANDNISGIMRRVDLSRKTSATPNHYGDNQCRDTGRQMNHQTTGKIHNTHFSKPTTALNPVGYGHIDQQQPKNAKKKHTQETDPFGIHTNNQRWRNNCKRHLEHKEDDFRNRTAERIGPDVRKESLTKTTDILIVCATVTESQALSNY